MTNKGAAIFFLVWACIIMLAVIVLSIMSAVQKAKMKKEIRAIEEWYAKATDDEIFARAWHNIIDSWRIR